MSNIITETEHFLIEYCPWNSRWPWAMSAKAGVPAHFQPSAYGAQGQSVEDLQDALKSAEAFCQEQIRYAEKYPKIFAHTLAAMDKIMGGAK